MTALTAVERRNTVRRALPAGVRRALVSAVWVVAGLAGVAAAWSVVVAADVFPRALFPSVPEIVAAGRSLWDEGLLADDLSSSLQRAAAGFVFGGVAGSAVAVVTATTAVGRNLLQPVLRVLSPIPTIGLIPLVILWFGLGESSKILVIGVGVFVPVWINAHAGIASTPREYLLAARCLGASRIHTLRRVILPEAAPDIVAGLRVGAAMAFVLIVVAEMTGTTAGIGYRISQAQLFSQADRLIVCLLILGVVGALCDITIAAVSAPLTRWSTQER